MTIEVCPKCSRPFSVRTIDAALRDNTEVECPHCRHVVRMETKSRFINQTAPLSPDQEAAYLRDPASYGRHTPTPERTRKPGTDWEFPDRAKS